MTKLIKLCLTGLLFILWGNHSMADSNVLEQWLSFETNGAREIAPFKIDNRQFLAIAQLAKDIPDTKANMNGGDSDLPVQIYELVDHQLKAYQQLPAHGSESVTHFQMDGHDYLAVASIRSGSNGDYNYDTYSMLYRWDGKVFYPVQQFRGYASKDFTHFQIKDEHFLALANGVATKTGDDKNNSVIYKYDGKQFQPFQTIPSTWGYSFHFFEMDGKPFLAFADHTSNSVIYQFDGEQFKPFQTITEVGGRAFEYFQLNNQHYLAFANISHPSVLYQFNGKQFKSVQTFDGLGGRSFNFFNLNDTSYLLQIKFITGGRDNPQTEQESPLYVWQDNEFKQTQLIKTFGGVVANIFYLKDKLYIALANSLSKDIRFKTNSVIYRANDPKHE